ncbi:UbiX family flavin prenyltransferase [Treponema sp.]
MKRYVLGITGASPSIYGLRAARAILQSSCELHLLVSAQGEKVLRYETGFDSESFAASLPGTELSKLKLHRIDDYFSSLASGSFPTDGMLILPCSMNCAGSIAQGTGGDLLRRAADVHLKERRPLVIAFREAPLSSIHLRNLLTLSEAGAIVMPAAPGFYGKPESLDDIIDFVVGRTLRSLGLENNLGHVWQGV